MLLAIDIGNSRIKVAVFEKDTEISNYSFLKEEAFKNFKKIFKNHPKINHAVSSSVGNLDTICHNYIKTKANLTEIDANTTFPFQNLYSTPKTLGVDRMVVTAGASLLYPNQNVLIIDCGTCITYDLLTNKNTYLGGAISPGLTMRYKSLHTYTAKLPLLEKSYPDSFIGNSTNQSIHSGIINGISNEIEGCISQYSLKFSDLTIILTGGDAIFLAKSLKSTIFVRSNFLLESLNKLFNYLEKN
ncbi:type III pantothenate kinase [Flavobacterium sp.]|uniref:type III pantothenate kinase n=1 Tax=Flavobacterium sp. TaxID=239 RepID=UPI0035294F15